MADDAVRKFGEKQKKKALAKQIRSSKKNKKGNLKHIQCDKCKDDIKPAYIDFKKHYESALDDNIDEDTMKKRLTDAFKVMEEENSILVEAMNRDKERQDKAKREGK